MNEIEPTIYGISKLEKEIKAFQDNSNTILKRFLDKFSGKNSDVTKYDDDVSLELKETFLRLMEVKELTETIRSLLSYSHKSLQFAKNSEVSYSSSDEFVYRSDMHDFLVERVLRGDESEWALVFNTSSNLGTSKFVLDGIIYSEATLDIIFDSHFPGKDILDSDLLFPEDCLEEKKAVMIRTNDNELIKIVD